MKEITIADVIESSSSLAEAIKGVDQFIFNKCSDTEPTRESVSMLAGLMQSLIALATQHENEVMILDKQLTVSCHE